MKQKGKNISPKKFKSQKLTGQKGVNLIERIGLIQKTDSARIVIHKTSRL